MSEADRAYEAALKEIERAKRQRDVALHLTGRQYRELDRIPLEIREIDWLKALNLSHTNISDISALSTLTQLEGLRLNNTQIFDLSPLSELKNLIGLRINMTNIKKIKPLENLKNLTSLRLNNTGVEDITSIPKLVNLRSLKLDATNISDLRPLVSNKPRNSFLSSGLSFRNVLATKFDGRLKELSEIKKSPERTRETLAYLRTLPPWPEPYTPDAPPRRKPSEADWGKEADIDAQAETLSNLMPLAEELVQNPETGAFSVRYKQIEKPDLLAATLGQVADAIEDVLHDPSNGLNDGSLDIRKLKRTLERYANDPQRVEMDFTTVHQSLTRQIASTELPPSDENLALLTALEEGALGIRATDSAVAVNRRILQEQKLRELSPEAVETIKEAAPILEAITEGDLQTQMREDVLFLTEEMQALPPRLPGVTREDAIMPGRDEAVRVFGRTSRIVIARRKTPALIHKLHESTGFKAANITVVLEALVRIGLGFF